MAKVVLSVGIDFPGDDVEGVNILSDRSLLDADIIIFRPGIPSFYREETYLGKRCLDDDDSFRVREAFAHWRRELAAAVDAGKVVVLVLSAPETVYVGTGRIEYSGTGRNARGTRMVEKLNSYDSVPSKWKLHPASGTEMVLVPDARFLAPLWKDLEEFFEYRLYIEADAVSPLIRTRSGNRVVGAMVRRGSGALIGIPSFDFDDPSFAKTRKENGQDVEYWSKKGLQHGKRMVSALISMVDALQKESSATPPPEWIRDNKYRLKAETSLETQISAISSQLLKLEEEQRALKEELGSAGTLRRLLYEQGKPLEELVIESLKIMGFAAANLKEGDSEFDAVFESPEGRFIGEVEGKDTKAINIDKFSQLERNLNEDFAREGVTQFAKGVLFGNAYRLQPVSERAEPFTEKCKTAAVRLGVALVHTPDLFDPCRYIIESGDSEYARSCRRAIFEAAGTVVVFPPSPTAPPTVVSESPATPDAV
jgi:hypothetical protein